MVFNDDHDSQHTVSIRICNLLQLIDSCCKLLKFVDLVVPAQCSRLSCAGSRCNRCGNVVDRGCETTVRNDTTRNASWIFQE